MREDGSKDGNFTNWSKARGGIINVRRVETIVHRRRGLRRERPCTTRGAVRTPVHGPAFTLSLLGEGLFGPASALFPTGGENECHGEEDDDCSEPLMVGVRVGQGVGLVRRKKWVMGAIHTACKTNHNPC